MRYCEDAANDEFWQFEFNNGRSGLNSLPREPAHIVLQMVGILHSHIQYIYPQPRSQGFRPWERGWAFV